MLYHIRFSSAVCCLPAVLGRLRVKVKRRLNIPLRALWEAII